MSEIIKGNDIRPDAQGFDEVRIVTEPRYKTSDLSGDEWRISARIDLMRKGKVIESKSFTNVEVACGFAYSVYLSAIDNANGYFASEDDFCDQEGCQEKAEVFLKKKFEWCRDGHRTKTFGDKIRQFCKRHSVRGDCGLDDADLNYEILSPKKSEEGA